MTRADAEKMAREWLLTHRTRNPATLPPVEVKLADLILRVDHAATERAAQVVDVESRLWSDMAQATGFITTSRVAGAHRALAAAIRKIAEEDGK